MPMPPCLLQLKLVTLLDNVESGVMCMSLLDLDKKSCQLCILFSEAVQVMETLAAFVQFLGFFEEKSSPLNCTGYISWRRN